MFVFAHNPLDRLVALLANLDADPIARRARLIGSKWSVIDVRNRTSHEIYA